MQCKMCFKCKLNEQFFSQKHLLVILIFNYHPNPDKNPHLPKKTPEISDVYAMIIFPVMIQSL
jgi:hypothetical protein